MGDRTLGNVEGLFKSAGVDVKVTKTENGVLPVSQEERDFVKPEGETPLNGPPRQNSPNSTQ